jgi:hypothetical protein
MPMNFERPARPRRDLSLADYDWLVREAYSNPVIVKREADAANRRALTAAAAERWPARPSLH